MPDNINLSFALNLKPESIVKYFELKGYKFSFNWYEVWQSAHHKAFTVAKAMNLEVLQTIREEVEKAISEGTTLEQFQSELEPRLKKLGWWGIQPMFDNEGNLIDAQLGSPQRLQTIYETNLSVAYSVGRYEGMIENTDNRPYWQYVAVLDSNTRDSHRALHGKVYRYDHPFWNKYYPPNDWGCRCHVRALTPQQVKDKGLTIERKMPDKENLPPDEWNYNPAKKDFEPDLSKYDKELIKQYNAVKNG